MSKKEVPAASWVSVASLAPWAKNPRVNDDAAQDVARSIIRFGFGAPVISRAENREVIAGHSRLKAVALLRVWWGNESEDAKKTWSADARKIATDLDPQVPVRFLDLSESEAHALALADNKIDGAWDDEALLGVLRDLAAGGVDLDGLGWDDGVLDGLIDSGDVKPSGGSALPINDTGSSMPWPNDWPEPEPAPFPWFGGKLRAAPLIWRAIGVDVPNYVEPFIGSCATLLARPPDPEGRRRTQTVNDADGFIANFWRAITLDPEATALAADWPVSEVDLSARHLWLVQHRAELTERLQVDPDHFDAKIAGWWVWGICSWIGSGWCSGEGPWSVEEGRWVNRREGAASTESSPTDGNAGQGINRKLPHLGNAGRGINRQLPHLGDAGQGINRQLPHLGNAGQGIFDAFARIAERLRDTRVACGDWRRVLSESVTVRHGTTGILLDPPYPDGFSADGGAYSAGSAGVDVWHDAAAWAVENGADKRLRIVLCGYAGTWTPPADWREIPWKARGGYGSAGTLGEQNAGRERLWLSPGCLDVGAIE